MTYMLRFDLATESCWGAAVQLQNKHAPSAGKGPEPGQATTFRQNNGNRMRTISLQLQ